MATTKNKRTASRSAPKRSPRKGTGRVAGAKKRVTKVAAGKESATTDEKQSRRRSITARKKEGVYRSAGDTANPANRRKRTPAKKRTEDGSTKKTARRRSQVRAVKQQKPEHRNIERSSREERRWEGDTHDSAWKEEVGVRGGRGDKEHFQTRGRDQQEPKKRRLQIRDERTGRKPRHDPYYYSRPRRRRRQLSQREGWRKYYRLGPDNHYVGLNEDESNIFGEHPSSAGRAEYLGGNKRHPGLVGKRRKRTTDRNYRQADRLESRRSARRERRSDSREPLTHKTSTRLAIEDYKNRMQFGMAEFHPMQIYDPKEVALEQDELELEEPDHMYQDEGYQHAGSTEGFGRRGGRQDKYSWLDEDEYREGHAPRKRGYGKYGSR
jgi:hypothetical protein